MKRVVIVGGGYAGTTLARALDAAFEVVLIEPREAFVHNVAAIRALVQPSLVDQIILPYGRLLKRGKVVHDRVSAVADGGVTLVSGRHISGDYVVLATGSTYAPPFKPATDAMADFRAASAASHAAIKDARSIAIVGAGAVGVELAGEIASALKGKEVTLISSTPSLFPDFAPGLGKRLKANLKAMGVKLILGVKAQGLVTGDRPQPGPLHLETGEVVASDLVIPAIGARPEVNVLAGVSTAGFDPRGRVEVDGWMRPAGFKRVFALGDMAANGDHMTIVASSRQAPWLAKALTDSSGGKAVEDMAAYTAWASPPILVPLGLKRGASVLPIGRNGAVVGPLLTGAIKGKSLFIPRYRKEFGL